MLLIIKKLRPTHGIVHAGLRGLRAFLARKKKGSVY
jgi:hypothetical protein